MAELKLAEGAAPVSPSAGQVTLYAKVDKKLYYKDSVGLETGPLGVGGAGSGNAIVSAAGAYTIPGAVTLRKVVYITGAMAADLSDKTLLATTVPLGLVSDKPTLTTATVIYAGEVPGFVGLLPGIRYYLSTLGAISATPPDPQLDVGQVLLQVGIAISTTTLLVNFGQRIEL